MADTDAPIDAIEEVVSAPECEPADIALALPPAPCDQVDTESTESLDATLIEAPPSSAVLGRLDALEAALQQRLDGLSAQFTREARAEATREKIVDRLHAELQDYKADMLLSTMRPVFLDLIQLHDDIGKVVASLAETPLEPDRLAGLLSSFQQGIEDILYRQGVEPFVAEDDAFDARRQRAVSTTATSDPDQARRIAARLRKGFAAGDRVIRPEIVSVYKLERES